MSVKKFRIILGIILLVTIIGGIWLGWDGLIDEVMIYNRALTPEEISALYNYTAPTYIVGAE